MRFSILIPSKNGEYFIENCIKSILDQVFKDYEIVIGNNNNNEVFNKIISRYISNEKINVINHSKDITVTENWQSCLSASNGDYVIMLGDDDCLLKDALININQIIEKNNNPECLSFNGISFYSSNSFQGIKFGGYSNLFFDYSKKNINEGWLSKEDRFKIVKKMYSFENLLPLNMQPHIISKLAISRVKKNIYQPPFPDHYALNALLLTSRSWYVSYKKVVAVGISNKSFGHYYFNSRLSEGIQYLGLKVDLKNQIEGSILNTCMMMWLLNIKKDYPLLLQKVKIKRKSYLYRQIFFMTYGFFKKNITLKVLVNFFIKLKFYDKLLLLILPFHLSLIIKGFNKLIYNNKTQIFKLKDELDIYEFTRKSIFK